MKRLINNPKFMAAACLLYVVWPIDLLPDVIPLLGFLDDLAMIGLTVRSTVNSFLPKETIIEGR
jgi:uncharacterized membrane protein YkvA (DUF1232 family)